MYHNYQETIQESPVECKKREQLVLDKSISLLLSAQQSSSNGKKVVEALFYTSRVWVLFIQDLISENNQLPQEVKLNLISIGLWILKKCELIRNNKSNNYQEIIDIIAIVRDGLK
ncbi:flagellar biosynthesis regulator FlaF [Candidatus Liberibacter brunswickensis]|uniref:flagellar biosynthesis regulator FlaF n=1 Tax=Candidatus Liberibacter brunswickensis TaxID=1968796 RepID=UPI002FE289D3